MVNDQKPSAIAPISPIDTATQDKPVDKEYTIWWDEKEEVLREKPCGDIDEAYAKSMSEELFKQANTKPGNVLVLTDMSDGGSATSAARKIFAEELKNKKYSKHAFFGLTTFTRILVSFIVRASGVQNVGYFPTEQEALKWLKRK
jgi:UDP-N-acetylmuramyl pentapeptide synthase